nr:retrovirus-related Pol polyprotein from transposon TNT 1-94 [Tanacetum cinerariifolium]
MVVSSSPIEAVDQAIQTILLGLPEDIYAVDGCETAQEIWLHVQQMMKGSDIGIQEKKAKLFNEWERFTSNDEESIESYYHRFLKLMNDLKRNKHFLEKIARNANQNPNGNGNLVAARAERNANGYNDNQIRCYNCKGVGHFARNYTVRPKRRDAAYLQTQLLIAQKEEAGIQLQVEEFDLMVAAADLNEIEEVNENCILMANLQQASTSEAAKFVGNIKSLAKEADESLAKHKALELEIERLLRAVVSQDIMSVVQNNYVSETSNLQTELERTKERFENCIIKKENEYAKLWNDWYKKCEECKFDKISYDKAYKDMQQKIEWLQAQLGDLKGKSKDTSCVSDTLNSLSQKLENENVELDNSRLWHQHLSHLNFDTIIDLAKNDLVSGLPKFKYHKEHLCPSCEQEKRKRASHPPKPVPNSRQRLHLLHMDLCGPMRIASINGKR